MADYINREDAVRILCRETCHPGAFCPDSYCVEMWDKLSEIPSADVPQWIPCRERTPETGYAENRLTIASYIVTMQRTTKDKKYSSAVVDFARFIPERKDGKWQGGTWQNDWLVSNEKYDTEVIAWMPIPKPYDPIMGAMNPPE